MKNLVITPFGEIAPGWIRGLFLDKGLKVELRVVLICLCAWIRQKPILVEFFSNLFIFQHESSPIIETTIYIEDFLRCELQQSRPGFL